MIDYQTISMINKDTRINPGVIMPLDVSQKEWGQEMIGRKVRVKPTSVFFSAQGKYGWGIITRVEPSHNLLPIHVNFNRIYSFCYSQSDLIVEPKVVQRKSEDFIVEPKVVQRKSEDFSEDFSAVVKFIGSYGTNPMQELNPNQKALLSPELQTLVEAGYMNYDMSFTAKMRDAVLMIAFQANKEAIVAQAQKELDEMKKEAEDEDD